MLVCAKTIRCRPFRSNPVTIPTTSHILPIPTRTHTYRLHRQRTSIRAMSSSLPPSHEHVKVRREYGSWESPITAQVVAGSCKRVNGFAVAGDGRLLWVESRPNEGGRTVLVREPEREGDEPTDITPANFAVRTLAQEYGGVAFSVSGNMVIFSNYQDQRLYKQIIGGAPPIPITPDYGDRRVRYADGVIDSNLNRYITVMEDHHESSQNPKTTIAAVDIMDGNIQEPKVLISGCDFYGFPRIDPSGKKIAWIQWNHPNMPWDRSELWIGYISNNGDLQSRVCIAGCDADVVESPTEPKWSPEGELFFITDRKSGFWNIYKWHIMMERTPSLDRIFGLKGAMDSVWAESCLSFVIDPFNSSHLPPLNEMDINRRISGGLGQLLLLQNNSEIESKNKVEPVFSLNAEFTRPMWVFGMSSYDFIKIDGKTHIACSYRQNGKSYFGILDCLQSSFSLLDIHLSEVGDIVSDHQCLYIECASATHPTSIAKLNLENGTPKLSLIWSSCSNSQKYLSYISMPEVIVFPTEVPGENAYAYFYPPTNPTTEPHDGEKPPLLLKSHGGPTGESRGILDLNIQYFTSRGWAFVDVNYGGSTGYGREYRERLFGRWGITDVNDCCSCAKFLVESGRVDANRLCITGSSAGGYTTLAALAFRNTFKAGASRYGIGDLALMRAETHKFESHYLDNLIGGEHEYFERSPFNFVDKFSCPVILFQGLEDKVVPPDQARRLYKALKEKGLPVSLVEYEGEQHGFKKAENIVFTLEQTMLFFARVVGKFELHDKISPIKIDNFD